MATILLCRVAVSGNGNILTDTLSAYVLSSAYHHEHCNLSQPQLIVQVSVIGDVAVLRMPNGHPNAPSGRRFLANNQ